MKKSIIILVIAMFVFGVFAQKQSDVNQQLIVIKKAINFIAMGDFGCNGEYSQKEVAT